jgi:hypothetical protein
VGADGQVWGLAPDAVFAVDPATETVRRVADLPEPFTAGFAAGGDSLYYASGPKVYRFRYRQAEAYALPRRSLVPTEVPTR